MAGSRGLGNTPASDAQMLLVSRRLTLCIIHYKIIYKTFRANKNESYNSLTGVGARSRASATFFTARLYASAIYAVVVYLSVRLSVCSSVCHKPELCQNG